MFYIYLGILKGAGFFWTLYILAIIVYPLFQKFLPLNAPFVFYDFNHILLWSVLFSITRVFYVMITIHVLSETTK